MLGDDDLPLSFSKIYVGEVNLDGFIMLKLPVCSYTFSKLGPKSLCNGLYNILAFLSLRTVDILLFLVDMVVLMLFHQNTLEVMVLLR